MTTLSSKIINVHKKKMAKIAVDAVMAVANLDRNDVNFDMIKVRHVYTHANTRGCRHGASGIPADECERVSCVSDFTDLALLTSYRSVL